MASTAMPFSIFISSILFYLHAGKYSRERKTVKKPMRTFLA